MSLIKHVTLQKIVAHDFWYDLRTIVIHKITLRKLKRNSAVRTMLHIEAYMTVYMLK